MYPPDDSPCWSGEWQAASPLVDLWAHSAVIRTVAALPNLHAWRLGDDKGSRRSVLWCASPADLTGAGPEGVAVLTQTAPPPSLPVGDVDSDGDLVGGSFLRASSMTDGLLSALAIGLSRATADAIGDAVGRSQEEDSPTPSGAPRPFRSPDPGVRQWIGGMVQLPGSWLPELAILPNSRRDIDDPGTGWDTESMAFAVRHSVHAADTRFASDVLAPHVTALVLDQVPADAAVTLAGDAIHVWWEYTDRSRTAAGKVVRTVDVARRIRDAIPSFVLADHPDHSHRVEDRLAERAARAAAYRASRATGRHTDPTLQRIYDTAQAEYEASRTRD
jgi:hypothetical protein